MVRQLACGSKAPFSEAEDAEPPEQTVLPAMLHSTDVWYVLLQPPGLGTEPAANAEAHAEASQLERTEHAAQRAAVRREASSGAGDKERLPFLARPELADGAGRSGERKGLGGAGDGEARWHLQVSVLAVRGEISEELEQGLQAARSYLASLALAAERERAPAFAPSPASVPPFRPRRAPPSACEGGEEALEARAAWLAAMTQVQVQVSVHSLALGVAVGSSACVARSDTQAAGISPWSSASSMLVAHVDGVVVQWLELEEEEAEEDRDQELVRDMQGLQEPQAFQSNPRGWWRGALQSYTRACNTTREVASLTRASNSRGANCRAQHAAASTAAAPAQRCSASASEAGVGDAAAAGGESRLMGSLPLAAPHTLPHASSDWQPVARGFRKRRARVKLLGDTRAWRAEVLAGLRWMRTWEERLATPVDAFDLQVELVSLLSVGSVPTPSCPPAVVGQGEVSTGSDGREVRVEETKVRVSSSVVSVVVGPAALEAIAGGLGHLDRLAALVLPHAAGPDASIPLPSPSRAPSAEARAESIRPSALYPDLGALLGSEAAGHDAGNQRLHPRPTSLPLMTLLGSRLVLDVELEGLQVLPPPSAPLSLSLLLLPPLCRPPPTSHRPCTAARSRARVSGECQAPDRSVGQCAGQGTWF